MRPFPHVADLSDTERLTLAEAARTMRAAVRNKAYRGTPLGLVVGQYMRQKKWGGAAENTLLAYESVLARFALDHADLELSAFEPPLGIERLVEFLDLLGATPRRRRAAAISPSSATSSPGAWREDAYMAIRRFRSSRLSL